MSDSTYNEYDFSYEYAPAHSDSAPSSAAAAAAVASSSAVADSLHVNVEAERWKYQCQQLEGQIASLESDKSSLAGSVQLERDKFTRLMSKYSQLILNISRLYQTAKAELDKKNQLIQMIQDVNQKKLSELLSEIDKLKGGEKRGNWQNNNNNNQQQQQGRNNGKRPKEEQNNGYKTQHGKYPHHNQNQNQNHHSAHSSSSIAFSSHSSGDGDGNAKRQKIHPNQERNTTE